MSTSLTWPPAPAPLTADQIRAARLFACEHAVDVADARVLLGALGIGAGL